MNRRQFGAAVSSIGLAGVIHNLRVPALALASGTRGSRSRPMGERQFPKNVAGIRIVDSRVAREAAELARESSPPYLFNHAARTYVLGALIGRARGQAFDEELLYLSCILHDLGLTERFAGELPFEIEGAIAAERFLRGRGFAPERAAVVWDGIAMHPLPIAEYKRPEIALVAAGAGADVVGAGLERINEAHRAQVMQAFPRLGFKRAFVATCAAVVARYPGGAGRTFMRDIGERAVPGYHPGNICDAIERAPFAE